MPSMKWLVVGLVGVALARIPTASASRSPSDDGQTAPRNTAQAEQTPTPPAKPRVAFYKSKHGYVVEYPRGWVLQAFIEEEATIGKGIANGSVFHLYNYDPDHVANPGDPVPPDKIKIEVLLAKRAFHSYDEWLKTIPRVRSVKDFVTAAGRGKEVVNVEADLENDRTFVNRRVILLTPTLEIDFHYYPIDATARAAFDRVVASFRETR